MKFWWIADGDRVEAEFAAVQAAANERTWFELDSWTIHEWNLAATGTLLAHGHRYPVRLVYPDQFPEVPAWVEPQDNVRWSNHQYGEGGILCLELRPDNWVSSATGADLLRSAHSLLQHENPKGRSPDQVLVAPSAHQVGDIQSYGWWSNPLLIGAGCYERIVSGSAEDVLSLCWMGTESAWPMLIHDSEDRKTSLSPPGTDVRAWRVETPVLISEKVPPRGEVSRKSVIEAGGFDEEIVNAFSGNVSCLVIFRGTSDLTAYRLFDENNAQARNILKFPDQTGMRSGRTAEAQLKKVAIIGAGSIGSKISESLVRSGVTKLTIIDGDILLPANLERHALDWRDVGSRKAQVLQRRLLDIAPGATVDIVSQNLNWQSSAKTHSNNIGQIAECDVIVDATGSPATALYLGAIASANQRPFFSVEVFEGGIGALISACLPNRDPPYANAREGFLEWCTQQDAPLPASGNHNYEALNAEGVPVVADDAAVTTAAGHATRIILDVLDDQPAPREAAWILIGFKKGWVFDGHGHSIRLDLGRPQPPAPHPRTDSQSRVFSLFMERINNALKDSD